jgi:oligosaccharide translocation protein RFT1
MATFVACRFLFFDQMLQSTSFAAFGMDIIAMYSLGALLELCGEPWFNSFQSCGNYAPRLKADTVAVFVRSAVTCYAVAWRGMGVHGFGYAQVSYGITHLVMMMLASHQGVHIDHIPSKWSDFLPRWIIDTSTEQIRTVSHSERVLTHIIDTRTAAVAFRATLSSILKHVLTEADKIALSVTSSPYDQGIFAVANNYGSLVARMVLLPIEESARLNFSQRAAELRQLEEMLPTSTTASSADTGPQDPSVAVSDAAPGAAAQVRPARVVKAQLAAATTDLANQLDLVLFLVSCLGIAFLVFGPCYARIVVRLLFGRQYQSEESVHTLSMVCVNVFVLALNGVTEAFVHAVMPPTDFLRINLGFVASSVAYVVLVGPSIAYAGTSGLIIAGATSMLLRIASSGNLILLIFKRLSTACDVPPQRWVMMQVLVSPSVLRATALAAAVALGSSYRYHQSNMDTAALIQHVGVGAGAFALFCGATLWNLSIAVPSFSLKKLRGK